MTGVLVITYIVFFKTADSKMRATSPGTKRHPTMSTWKMVQTLVDGRIVGKRKGQLHEDFQDRSQGLRRETRRCGFELMSVETAHEKQGEEPEPALAEGRKRSPEIGDSGEERLQDALADICPQLLCARFLIR